MTEPCGCLCLPNPEFVDCVSATPIPQTVQVCEYGWNTGVLNGSFSPYAPIRWGLGYSPSGNSLPVAVLYPVTSGYILATNVWESDTISQDGGSKVFFFRLTISGLGIGGVLLEMVFSAHPVSGFPSTIKFINKVHLRQTIQGSNYGLCFPEDWIEENYTARSLVVDRLLIDFPCCFRLGFYPLRTYLPGTIYTGLTVSFDCTYSTLPAWAGKTYTGTISVPYGSPYVDDNYPTFYGSLFEPGGKSVLMDFTFVINCNSYYGLDGTITLIHNVTHVGLGPDWYGSLPLIFSGGGRPEGAFESALGTVTITGLV